MAQVTVYIPDALEKVLRREAKKAGKSVSAFLAGLAERALGKPRTSPSLKRLYGSWEGEFPEPEDPVPDEPGTW